MKYFLPEIYEKEESKKSDTISKITSKSGVHVKNSKLFKKDLEGLRKMMHERQELLDKMQEMEDIKLEMSRRLSTLPSD